MPSEFKIRFPTPAEKVAVATVVVDSGSVEEDDPDLTVPPTGPDDVEVSPAIQINTGSESGAPQPRSLSYPDVQMLPIATSTSGQESVIHRTPSTGIIATWNEAVNGFGIGDIEVTVDTDSGSANASLRNFRGVEGSTSYTFQVVFPTEGSGSVVLRIPANSAISVANGRDGPVGSRYLRLQYDFARGTIDGTPAVEIQVPARSPYYGRTAPIGFLFNIPVINFTQADVTFTNNVTMSEPVRTSNALLWEAELTLPDVSGPTQVTVTVAQDSVTSQGGIEGPEDPEIITFSYDTPASATTGAPSGTTLICDTEQDVDDLNYLSSIGITGGGLYGITDLVKIGTNLYGVAQVRRRRAGRTNELADTLEAGAALFRVNLSNNTCTILKAYPSVLEAARSLVQHNNRLYFFEGTGQLYTHGFGCNPADNPRVGNLGTYDPTSNCLSTLGKVWRIALGRQQGTDFEKDFGIAGGTFSPLVSAGDRLLALPGTGNVNFVNYAINRRYLFQKRSSEPASPTGLTYNPDTNLIEGLGDWSLAQPADDENLFGLFEDNVYVQVVTIDASTTPARVLLVGDVQELNASDFTAPDAIYGIPTSNTGDSVSADITNWGLLSYSNNIEPRLALLPTNNLSAWDLMQDFARMTLTIMHFQDGLAYLKPRLPVRAVLTSALTDSATTLSFRYSSVNRPFPAQGTLLLGSEVISYTSAGTSSLGALTRGQGASVAAAHDSGDSMTLVHHVLQEHSFATPIEQVTIQSDGTNLYNSIVVRFDDEERTHIEQDEDSISRYGERELRINAGYLSRHQSEWAAWIARHSLSTFKDMQYLLRMQLLPRFDIDVGDYIYLDVPRDQIRRVALVVRVQWTSRRDAVSVDARTITI